MTTQESERPAMSTPPHKQLGTYAVYNLSDDEELKRLQLQDDMMTASMGGVLSEQAAPERFEHILDISCGPGGWLLQTAQTYPSISRLVGVDISQKMIDYARARAKALHLEDRVEFHQMDALRQLAFPAESFDLVNERGATSWLRTWDWPAFLQECQRVTRPSGVIRVNEPHLIGESTSPALTRLCILTVEALHQSGHIFTPEGDGVTKELVRLLSQHGLQDVQMHTSVMEYRAGTPEGQLLAEDVKRLYRLLMPFLQKWTHVPDDYEQTYQQMLVEVQQPGFVSNGLMVTAWGTRSASFVLPA